MSFKSRLIDYCENTVKKDCPYCPFKEPCDEVTPDLIPSRWSDGKFDEMRSNTWEYMKSMSNKMSVISGLMQMSVADDVTELNKQANEFSHKLDKMEESKGG